MFSSTLTSQKSIFDNLDYYRVSTNFNGSAYNGRTILAYGEGGVIVRSTDNGNNWTQTNLNDSFNIISITNIGYDFYGVLSKQFIIKSTDDGINWQQFDIGNNTEFFKILPYNSNLYCLSNNIIIVFNSNIEKLKEFTLTSDTTYYDFTISDDKSIYSAGLGKIGIINLQNDNTNLIDLKGLGICTDCPIIKNLFSDANFTFFELGNNLYQFDGKSVNFIFSPTKNGIYTSNNGNLYELYNIINTSTNLDSLYFIKINKQNHNSNQIKMPVNDRYITSLNFRKIAFLTSDMIIAVGYDKLIYMSYDKGHSWQLKSHLNLNSDYGDIIRFDNDNANSISTYSKFISTHDGGISWKPQINYEPEFVLKPFLSYQYPNGTYFMNEMNGFFYGSTINPNDSNIAYTKDGCNTVFLKSIEELKNYLPNKGPKFCTIGDYSIFSLQGKVYDLQYSLLFKIDDNLNIERLSYLDSIQILYFDKYKNDEIVAITVTYKYPRDSSKYTVYDSLYYSLITSNDGGKTWIRNAFDFYLYHSKIDNLYAKKIKDIIIINYNYSLNNIGIFEIYKLDLKNKSLIKLFSNNGMSSLGTNGIGSIENKIYFGGVFFTDTGFYKKLYENDDIENNPDKWIDVTPQTRYGNFSMVVRKDSLIYMTAYDSLMKSNVMWFAKPKKVTNVDEQVEVSNYLYLSKPYPNPSQAYVKTKFYWDIGSNIDDAIIEVYDIMGNVVSDKTQILFNQINNYSGEITWLTKNQNSGVYIISVKLGGNTKAIPVVVVK